MLFTPKAFQGSEKSTVDLSFSLSYFRKEVEVRDKFPAHFMSPSVSQSVITGCVCHFWITWNRYRYRYDGAEGAWLAKRADPGTHVPTTHTAPKAPLLARKASRAPHRGPSTHFCGAVGAALGSESEPIQGTQLPWNSPRTAPKAPLLARIIIIPVNTVAIAYTRQFLSGVLVLSYAR